LNFFASEAFLSTLAEVSAPGRPFRLGLYRTAGQLFRLVSVDGGRPICSRAFFDSVAPVDDPGDEPVQPLRYLPVTRRETREITSVPAPVPPDCFPAPYIDWTRFPSWEAFEAHFTERRSSLPRDSRQKRRNLERERGPSSFIVHDERPAVFDQCLAWKSAQYVRTGLPDMFADPRNVELFRRLLAKKALLISSLSAGDRLVAVHFGGLAADGVYSWVAAYDPDAGRYSPGRLLLEQVLGECHARGHHEFDFGIGHSDYKWHYATHNRALGPLGQPPVSLVVRQRTKAAVKGVLVRWPALYERVRALRARLRGRTPAH
jgi:hypothetical protein